MVEVAVKMDVAGSAVKAEDDVYMVLKGKQNHLEFLDIQVWILGSLSRSNSPRFALNI